MTLDNPTSEDLFLNVRRAYRLLHDYQQMVLDAIRYIGSQLDITENGGMGVFSRDAGAGRERKLTMPSWDYLPLMLCEFHFIKNLDADGLLSLSFFVVSDTGFYQGNPDVVEKGYIQTFEKVEEAKTKLLVLLRPGHFVPHLFKEEAEAREFFVEGQISNPEAKKAWICQAFGMDQILTEEKANGVVERILEMAKERGFPLQRKNAL